MTATPKCVTHHHACDCREAMFTDLQDEVGRLRRDHVAMWNALQAITEYGIDGCNGCHDHDFNARMALKSVLPPSSKTPPESASEVGRLRAALKECVEMTGINEQGFAVTMRLPQGECLRVIHGICMDALDQTPPESAEEKCKRCGKTDCILWAGYCSKGCAKAAPQACEPIAPPKARFTSTATIGEIRKGNPLPVDDAPQACEPECQLCANAEPASYWWPYCSKRCAQNASNSPQETNERKEPQ